MVDSSDSSRKKKKVCVAFQPTTFTQAVGDYEITITFQSEFKFKTLWLTHSLKRLRELLFTAIYGIKVFNRRECLTLLFCDCWPAWAAQLEKWFSVVFVEKQPPWGGKTRGSGTEKRCSQKTQKWFRRIFPCKDPCTNTFCKIWRNDGKSPVWITEWNQRRSSTIKEIEEMSLS